MKELKHYIKQSWIETFNAIDTNDLADIYVFSFFVYDDEDDPRLPTLTIGYNTVSNYKNETGDSDDDEVKWNYAFWLQNDIKEIGILEDKKGRELIHNWICNNNLNYTDEDLDKNFDACITKGAIITEEFVETLIEIVQESHQEQLTQIPILIHKLEYDITIREQNILANGKERVAEFTNWVNELLGISE